MTCTILSTGDELKFIGKNEEEPPLSDVKNRLLELIQGLLAEGCDSFYVNCDWGIPMWAAEIILELRKLNPLELHIMVPYEEQAKVWAEHYRDRYFKIHEQADSVTMISAQFYKGCIEDANFRMIDESDVLVICGQRSALADAAEHAEEQGLKVGDVMLL